MSTTTTTTTITGCPAWCSSDPDTHDEWHLNGPVIEREHQRDLFETPGLTVTLSAAERLILDVEAIQSGGTIADTSRIERPAGVVHFDAPGIPELGAVELRRLIAALTDALAIIEAQPVGDPMDETDKRDRIDGGGCIWEWDGLIRMWTHAGEELEPSTTLAFINEAAGPIRFLGAR